MRIHADQVTLLRNPVARALWPGLGNPRLAAPDDVAFHAVVFGRHAFPKSKIAVHVRNLRIAIAIGRGVVLHGLKRLTHGLVDHILPDGIRIEASGIGVDGRTAVNEDVVLNPKIATATEQHAILAGHQHILGDMSSAENVLVACTFSAI